MIKIRVPQNIAIFNQKIRQNGLGARPLLREIKSAIEIPIVEAMLLNGDNQTYKIKASIINNEIKICKENPVEI